MNKYFYIPGYYSHFNLIQILDLCKKDYPFYFYPDRIIAGAYDLPSGLKWNGGRGFGNDLYSEEKIEKIMHYFFNKQNFILLHTCTNFYADQCLNDKRCNYFINKYYRPQDKIIIANSSLKKYLFDKYYPIQFVNSTTLNIVNINEVNKISKNEEYVPYYGKNIDNEYFKNLKYKENIEILCGELCIPNCPMRTKHYEAISESYLGNNFLLNNFKCPQTNNLNKLTITELIKQLPTFVSNERINTFYNMGYNKFKIAGRTLQPWDWVQVIVYYFVKPEYNIKILNMFQVLLKEMKIEIINN